VGEDLIVESEVIAGNDVDASLLLNVPVLKAESLCLSEELSLGDLASPVSFSGLLQLTVCSHAGETEDRSVVDMQISMVWVMNASTEINTYD
jgi:hypothetical protein